VVTDPDCIGDGPAHGAQRVLDNADHMGTGIVHNDDTPREHDGTLSLEEGTKVPGGGPQSRYALTVTTLGTKELNESSLVLF
jgi:hypothetical protein